MGVCIPNTRERRKAWGLVSLNQPVHLGLLSPHGEAAPKRGCLYPQVQLQNQSVQVYILISKGHIEQCDSVSPILGSNQSTRVRDPNVRGYTEPPC